MIKNSIERHPGGELLRIVLMMLICVRHVVYHGGLTRTILPLNAAVTVNILYALGTFAVDGFALLSGYFYSSSRLKISKIINLWFVALFYSICFPLGLWFLNHFFGFANPVETSEIIKAFLPISFGNWYFQSYFAAFLLMPIVHRGIINIDKKEARIYLIISTLIFTVLPLINDVWFSSGYSAFWILILFFEGQLLKKTEIIEQMSVGLLSSASLICISVVFVFIMISPQTRIDNYTSPFVLLPAIGMLGLFLKIRKVPEPLLKIAPLTFGIYLFHDNAYFRLYFLADRFEEVFNNGLISGLITVIASAMMVFIVSAVVEQFRSYIFRLLKVNSIGEMIGNKIGI